jgi:hypothetical protein
VAGTCDPASGACSNPTAPNGTACNDSNACTTNDVCTSGACVGGPALSCDDNNSCTTDTCDPASGCVHTPIPGCGITGSDVGIVSFSVPSDIKDCRKAVPIQIKVRNFGTTVTGTITLYKDGVAVQIWSNVNFNKNSIVSKLYLYDPAGDAGKTINWMVEVDVPNDPDLSNNTSIGTTTVVPCEKT